MHDYPCLPLSKIYIEIRVYCAILGTVEKENMKMPIRYKFDVLEALKEAGYSTYKIRKEKILSESTVQAFRRGELVALDNIGRVCELLQCQPGDILEYTAD